MTLNDLVLFYHQLIVLPLIAQGGCATWSERLCIMFKILQDTLRPTTGLDWLPASFLELAAPVFCGPVADLINLTHTDDLNCAGVVDAGIHPAGIPKTPTPTPQQLTDYRPISITPVLTRLTERVVVRHYIYPALSSPPPALQFDDQFAFRLARVDYCGHRL